MRMRVGVELGHGGAPARTGITGRRASRRGRLSICRGGLPRRYDGYMGRIWYIGGMIRRLGGEGGRYIWRKRAEAFRDEKRVLYAMEVWNAWSVGYVVRDTH